MLRAHLLFATLACACSSSTTPVDAGSIHDWSALLDQRGDQGPEHLSWVRAQSGVTQDLFGVVRDIGPVWIAVGAGGTIVVSSDGQSWASVGTPTSEPLYAVGHQAMNKPGYVAVGGSKASGVILTSSDAERGDLWASRTLKGDAPPPGPLYTVTPTRPSMVALGDGAGTSDAGDFEEGWWMLPGIPSATFRGNADKYYRHVAVASACGSSSSGGCIFTVTDATAGKQWDKSFAAEYPLWAVAADHASTAESPSPMVAVGAGGAIAVSTDKGLTWSSVASGSSADLFAVARCYRYGRWLAVGGSGGKGVVLESLDAFHWTAKTVEDAGPLRGLECGTNDPAVLVGERGTILLAKY